MARNLTTGLQRGLRRSIAGGLGAGDLFSTAALDLRFAQQKTLDPRVTFTRASSGTYVGSDGLIKTATTNEPRFDHNPTTGESLGLLVEESRTNLLLRSEDLATTWLTFGTTVTANAATAPDGTATADKLVNTTANAEHGIYQTTTTSGSNTFTVFAKQAELRYLVLRRDFTPLIAVYDLQAGTVSQTEAGVTASITAFGSGWYRCSMTCSSTGNTVIKLSDVGTGVVYGSTYAGTAGQGIFVWGAQLEAGSFPTSYIPTTTATVTRSADVASITGSNFSSWYRQDEGTVFADARTQQSTAGHILAGVSTGSFASSAYLSKESDNILKAAPDASPSNLNIALSSVSSNAGLRSALAFTAGTGSASAVMNGGTVGADASTGIPITMDRLAIGSAPWNIGTTLWNGTIRRITYWFARLPNATLQQITR